MKNLVRFAQATLVCLACAAPAHAADVFLQSDYLQVGVDNRGTLIRNAGIPTGIKYDPSGTGDFSSPVDFLTPGTPFSFYSIGVDGSWGSALTAELDDPFSATTLDVGTPGVAGARTTGNYEGLDFVQTVFFNENESTVHATVTFTNAGPSMVAGVVYGVGFDPDQDVFINDVYVTENQIQGQGAVASASAYGAASRFTITLLNVGVPYTATASIRSPWIRDPYVLAGAAADDGDCDCTLNLGYDLGNFAAGEQKTISYDYQLVAVPVPEPQAYVLSLLGLALLGALARRRG